MNDLQEMAIRKAVQLLKEVDSPIIQLGYEDDKVKRNKCKDTAWYGVNEARKWLEATLNNKL